MEYALIAAAIAVPVTGGVQFLQGTAKDQFQQQANGMATPYSSRVEVAAETTVPSPATTTTVAPTTTAAPSTTTTVAPSTTTTTVAPSTTTTTVRPTTTTTTTVPRATRAIATLSNARRTSSSSTWSLATDLTVRDDLGAPVANAAVSVTVRLRAVDNRGNTSWSESVASGTTGANGVAVIDSGAVRRTGNPSIDRIEIVVRSVAAPGLTWDGATPGVNASAP